MQTDLLDFYERISSALVTKDGWVDCVFLGFQEEFDAVPHKRLVKILDFQTDRRGRFL